MKHFYTIQTIDINPGWENPDVELSLENFWNNIQNFFKDYGVILLCIIIVILLIIIIKMKHKYRKNKNN